MRLVSKEAIIPCEELEQNGRSTERDYGPEWLDREKTLSHPLDEALLGREWEIPLI